MGLANEAIQLMDDEKAELVRHRLAAIPATGARTLGWPNRINVWYNILDLIKDDGRLIQRCLSYQEMTFNHGDWIDDLMAHGYTEDDSLFAMVGFYGHGFWKTVFAEKTASIKTVELNELRHQLRVFNSALNEKAENEDLCGVYDSFIEDTMTQIPAINLLWERRETVLKGGKIVVEIDVDELRIQYSPDDFTELLRNACQQAVRDSDIDGRVIAYHDNNGNDHEWDL